ncbi:AsmA family protein [Chelatococcus sp. SYSU_G07232]|uniref:AsmA family protein n=1 Tax=Chelatococcus albus TaxID=3047466 RepID=A0ABT7AKN9_9HYPH|nr:AsmA-like C-terminal region-containing protein [Chelatococcus sp. SYSU_G07232]MDJ1159945.1 AsmA family protein [Chelatococcus sp. SYSU_G07232]
MTRRKLFFLALAALGASVLALAPWTVATESLARHVGRHFKAVSGLRLLVEGRATFALLPVPRIKLEEVTLVRPDGETAIRAEQLRGELRLLPLVAGQIELDEVTLVEPRIRLPATTDRTALWKGVIALVEREVSRGLAEGRRLHIGRIVVRDGTVVQKNAAGMDEVILRDVDLAADWTTVDQAMAASGSLVWRDEPVEIQISGLSPVALAAGRSSPLSLTLIGAGTTLTLDGRVADLRDPQFTGNVQFATTSLPRTARWIDLPLPLSHLIDNVGVEGPLSFSGRGLSLPNAQIRVGGDRLDGALTVRLDRDHPAVSGTIAADTLDLGRFVGPLAPSRGGDGAWSREALDPTRLAGDLDLRLSATTAQLGRSKLENVAAGFILRSGRMELSLARATAYGGTLKGRLTLLPAAGGLEAKLQGSFDGIDVSAALHEAADVRRLGGDGSGQIALEATGSSHADLARTLTGRVSLVVKRGEFTGVNLADIARRAERRPLSISLDWRSGRTAFDQLAATLIIAGGTGEIADGLMTAPGLRASLAGRIHIADRLFALKGAIAGTPSGQAAAPGSGAGFPFEITGSWDQPLVVPDVQALIQRSGAAAPLLAPPPAEPPRGLVTYAPTGASASGPR